MTTAKYHNMNLTHIPHFLHYLIFMAFGYMGSVVKGGINGVGVGLAGSWQIL